MSLLRRIVDMIAGKPSPPRDERSLNALQLEVLAADQDRALTRAERAIGLPLGSYRRVSLPRGIQGADRRDT